MAVVIACGIYFCLSLVTPRRDETQDLPHGALRGFLQNYQSPHPGHPKGATATRTN